MPQQDILRVELPVGDRLDLDLNARVECVHLLYEMDVDHHPVVEAECFGERIEGDLEAAVEVAAIGRLEVESHVDAEERSLQPGFDLDRQLALCAEPIDQLPDV